jgi:Tfp pilus assembly protein PilF
MEPVVVEGRPVVNVDLRAAEAIAVADGERADFLAKGDALVKDGKPGEAVFAYRKALSQQNDARAWSKLGAAYLQGVDRARGLLCLQEAVHVAPDDVDARLSLARAYLDAGQPELARAEAQDALLRSPDDVDAKYVLGRAFTNLSMWREAVVAFDDVVKEDPTNAYARNNLGFAALQIGENEKALAALEEIPSLPVQKPYMFNNLGVAYERAGKPAEALAAFSRAAELSPRYVKAAGNKERLLQQLTVDEQVAAAEALLAMREAPDAGPAGLAGEPVDLAHVERGDDAGVEELVSDHVVIEAGGGGSLAGAAVMAPSIEPSLP